MAIGTLYPSNAVVIKTAAGPVTWDLAIRETHTIELDESVHALDEALPDAPILGLSSKVGSPEEVTQPIYSLLRERQFTRFITQADTYTAADTVLDIAAADVGKVKRGYYILNTLTRVMFRVNGTPVAACPVEVVGEVADTTSISTDDELFILGYRGAELDTRFVDFVRLPDIIFNHVEEIQKAYEVSQYELTSGHVGGLDPLAKLRMQTLQDVRIIVEFGTLLGQRGKGLRTDADGISRMVWTTGGVDSFLTLNETDFSGTLTEAKLITAARQIRRHGPPERWGLASPLFMEKVDTVYATPANQNPARQLGPIPTETGMAITRLKFGGLTINFFEHPMLDDASATHANTLKEHCWVLNLSDLGYVTMNSELMGFFKWFTNQEPKGLRGKSDVLVVNYGVKMALPETHARWFSIA